MTITVVDPAIAAAAMESTNHRIRRMSAFVGAVFLIGSEIVFGDLAAGWAVSGLFNLGPSVMYGIDAVLLAASAVFITWFARLVWQAESRSD